MGFNDRLIGESLLTCEPKTIAMPSLDIDSSFVTQTGVTKIIQSYYAWGQGKQTKKGSYIKINTNSFYML